MNKSLSATKTIESLYSSNLIKDFKVEEDPLKDNKVVIHIMVDMDYYWDKGDNGYGGYHNISDIKTNIKDILRLIGITDVNYKIYLDNESEYIDKWNQRFLKK